MMKATNILKVLALLALLNTSNAVADSNRCLKNKLVLFQNGPRKAAASSSVAKLSSLYQVKKISASALSLELPNLAAAHSKKSDLGSEQASCKEMKVRCSEVSAQFSSEGWSCEPDYVLNLSATPNDAFFKNAALAKKKYAGDQQSAISNINPEAAWDIYTGIESSDQVVVAVIDTGVDYMHQDLSMNIWNNNYEIAGNNIDDDNNGYVDDKYGYDFFSNDGDPLDDNGHGTHVAGTIGALGNNNEGVTGMMWKARIMALKFLGANGSGSTSSAIAAINYAVANGAKVLNNSWGGGGYSKALQLAIQSASDSGVLVVAAAGNEANNNDLKASYPANLQGVLAVAATDKNSKLASFSNYGAGSVELAAPGVNILSTWPNGYYAYSSGTSMAAPHVSGAAALAWSLYPEMSAKELADLILNTVSPQANLASKVQSAGLLDMKALLQAVKALKESRSPTDENQNNPDDTDSNDDDLDQELPVASDSITLSSASQEDGAVKAGADIQITLSTASASALNLRFKLGRFNCAGAVKLNGITPGQNYSFSSELLKVASGFSSLQVEMYQKEGNSLLASSEAAIDGRRASEVSPKLRAAKACKRLVQGFER